MIWFSQGVLQRWLSAYRAQVRAEFEAAVAEERPTHVAASFAIGVFVTALPTLGAGLLVLGALARLFGHLNKVALFAAVAVLNPAVKSGVYVASFGLGARLLGPTETLAGGPSLLASQDVVARLLVGNAILTVALTVVGYVAANRAIREIRRGDVVPRLLGVE